MYKWFDSLMVVRKQIIDLLSNGLLINYQESNGTNHEKPRTPWTTMINNGCP
jgi:hypothetical protein